MAKSSVIKANRAARVTQSGSMIETLESRELFSVAVKPLVTLKAVSPSKILAGNKPATEVVTVHNYTTAAVTESVTVSLAPSLDGVTDAGSFGLTPVTETLTIKKRGSANIKVTFVPPTTLAAGKYHTIATVDVAGDIVTATAPGTYTLTLPPEPTTTPSLVGDFAGLIESYNSQSTGFFGGGTSTTIHELTFIWETTSQTATTLSGLFSVGDQSVAATMTGSELTNGTYSYQLTSPDITYSISGKIADNGTIITGRFNGTLVNNLFKKLVGGFKLKPGTTP
jgi:hypothetical protein